MSPTQHLGAAPEAIGPHHAAAILIDHRHARVIYLEDRPVDGGDIETEWKNRQFRVHDRHAKGGSGRAHPDPHDLFEAVARAASHTSRVVIAGPGSAKHELLRWADRHMPGMLARVHAVQTVDRITDGELVALARRSLHAEPSRMVWPRTETL